MQVQARGFLLLVSVGVVGALVAAACSDSSAPSIGATDDAGVDVVTTPEAAPPNEAGTPDASPSPSGPVTFSYRPSWKGVKTVEVVGAFGTATDWKSAFLTLADDGSGTFTGTAPALASGHYTYLFRVTGDEAAAAKADKLARYAIDPRDPAFVACPAASPTFSAHNSNPCSDLTVPQLVASPLLHVRGVVHSGGAPIAGYLIEIEREEPSSHHMFADRTTAGADGTFDLPVATGSYRLQVLHPTFYAMNDAQRTSPETFAAVRRTISSATPVTADVTLNPAEVAYEGYAAMTPRGATTLPTTFTFAVPAGTKARAAVYGPTPEIGDPWWVGPLGTATSDVFDGGFDTKQASDAGLKADAGYFWGTEQQYATPAGGVTWTAQSMVFPVQWP